MPPKKVAGKADSKKSIKVADDKSFGMKNKKGKKQQQQIAQIKSQVMGNEKLKQKAFDDKKKAQDAKKMQKDELNLLFRPTQAVAAGGDPKSVLCAFFVQGTCQKGNKCKFSHDMTLANKSAKRSMYAEEGDEEAKKEGMGEWDQDKLDAVIAEKHGDSNKRQTSKQICKNFLKAVEKNIYGWFWECPNGEKCIYKHALPPGFILTKDVVKDDDKKEVSLEELIDKERKKLGNNVTKVTFDTFTAWKARKLCDKKEKLMANKKKKKSDFKQGRLLGFSGREMFSYKPELADADDADAEDVIEREVEEEVEGETVYDVKETVIELEDEDDDEDDQPGPSATNNHNHVTDNIVIDENLFMEDGLEDLDLDDSDSDD